MHSSQIVDDAQSTPDADVRRTINDPNSSPLSTVCSGELKNLADKVHKTGTILVLYTARQYPKFKHFITSVITTVKEIISKDSDRSYMYIFRSLILSGEISLQKLYKTRSKLMKFWYAMELS